MKAKPIIIMAVILMALGLMANTIWIPMVSVPPAADEWKITKNMGTHYIPGVGNRQTMEFTNAGQGYVTSGYCLDLDKPVPPVGRVCSYDGIWHCGTNYQRFKPWQPIVTPTPTATPLPWTPTPIPTPTATATMTPTPTLTPTATPVCTFECPANMQEVTYPTMNFTFGFLESPEWGTSPHRVSMVYPNEARVNTVWSIPYQSINTDIRCGGTVYDVTKCDDGSCNIGCGDFGYSQSECTVETTLTFYACNKWVVCQGKWNLIDPLAEEAALMVDRGEAETLEQAHEILAGEK